MHFLCTRMILLHSNIYIFLSTFYTLNEIPIHISDTTVSLCHTYGIKQILFHSLKSLMIPLSLDSNGTNTCESIRTIIPKLCHYISTAMMFQNSSKKIHFHSFKFTFDLFMSFSDSNHTIIPKPVLF